MNTCCAVCSKEYGHQQARGTKHWNQREGLCQRNKKKKLHVLVLERVSWQSGQGLTLFKEAQRIHNVLAELFWGGHCAKVVGRVAHIIANQGIDHQQRKIRLRVPLQ